MNSPRYPSLSKPVLACTVAHTFFMLKNNKYDHAFFNIWVLSTFPAYCHLQDKMREVEGTL